MTWSACQEASSAGGLRDALAQLGPRSCWRPRSGCAGSPGPARTLSRCTPSTSASRAACGTPGRLGCGRSGVAGLRLEQPERVDPGVHAGHDGDTARGRCRRSRRSLKPAAKVAVGGEKVVEGPRVVNLAQSPARGAQQVPCRDGPAWARRGTARGREDGGERARTPQRRVKTVCSWAIAGDLLLRRGRPADRRGVGAVQISATERHARPARRSSGAARSW